MTGNLKYELNNTYLVIEKLDYEDDDYKIKMLNANHIEGILPIELRTINGKKEFYVSVSGKENLALCLQGRKITRKEVSELFENIYFIIERLSGYLITEKDICFNPEFIFKNHIKDTYEFVPLLNKSEEIKGKYDILSLLHFLLENIDSEDENLMNTLITVIEMYEGTTPKFELAFEFFSKEMRPKEIHEEEPLEVQEISSTVSIYIPTFREVAAVLMTVTGLIMVCTNIYMNVF